MVASLAAELQAAGSHNVLVAPADGEGWLARELRGTGVQVELFRIDRPLSPTFARWLTDLLRRHRIEVAHSHEFTMAVYGSWAARRAGVPHLFTMHGSHNVLVAPAVTMRPGGNDASRCASPPV